MQGWEITWKLVDGTPSAQGGQGEVRKVSDCSGRHGALKTMHTSSEVQRERRKRFAHEVESLKLTAGKGIPNLLDDNVANFLDTSVPLYYVQAWVDGDLLSKIPTPMGLDEALSLTAQLAEILDHCHQKGIVHRDIKPDNLILSKSGQLHLLDFGIAWLPADQRLTPEKTQIGQELGNRFLRLPELSSSSSAKGDSRSDVSFVTGILFYLLTGQAPRTLADNENCRPHERQGVSFSASTLADARYRIGLVGLFQANFSIELKKRHASMAQLIEALEDLRDPKPIDRSLREHQEAAYHAAINTALAQQERAVYEAMKRSCDEFVKKLREICPNVSSSLFEQSLAGGALREGNRCYNHVSIVDPTLGLAAEGQISVVREDGRLSGMFRIADTGIQIFYVGPEGDTVSLMNSFIVNADIYLGHALREHSRLLENRLLENRPPTS